MLELLAAFVLLPIASHGTPVTSAAEMSGSGSCNPGSLEAICSFMLSSINSKVCPEGTSRLRCNCSPDLHRCTTILEPVVYVGGGPRVCPCVSSPSPLPPSLPTPSPLPTPSSFRDPVSEATDSP